MLSIIVFQLFEHWNMLIVFLFLALILSIWLTIKSSNLRKVYFQISERHKLLSLLNVHYKISSVCLCICLSVRPFVNRFSQDLRRRFSYFFAWGYFAIYTNRQMKIVFCWLDDWVNDINLDQKQNIWHFNEVSITFCALNNPP